MYIVSTYMYVFVAETHSVYLRFSLNKSLVANTDDFTFKSEKLSYFLLCLDSWVTLHTGQLG